MAGWVKPSAMIWPVHSGTEAPATAATAKAPMTSPRPGPGGEGADPGPEEHGQARRTISGEARSVERMARPAVVSTMKFLMTEPTLEGSLYGLGPTASTMPTTVIRMKYAGSATGRRTRPGRPGPAR